MTMDLTLALYSTDLAIPGVGQVRVENAEKGAEVSLFSGRSPAHVGGQAC